MVTMATLRVIILINYWLNSFSTIDKPIIVTITLLVTITIKIINRNNKNKLMANYKNPIAKNSNFFSQKTKNRSFKTSYVGIWIAEVQTSYKILHKSWPTSYKNNKQNKNMLNTIINSWLKLTGTKSSFWRLSHHC